MVFHTNHVFHPMKGPSMVASDRICFCFQLDTRYNEFKLHSIMSEHKKTITAICWHPTSNDVMASCSADKEVIIWNISQQKVISRLQKLKDIPISISWNPQDYDVITYVAGRGPLVFWNFSAGGSTLMFSKEAQGFSSDIAQFRWHHRIPGKLVFGHNDGSISIIFVG